MTKMAMLHAGDPRLELQTAVGDLSTVEVFNNQILVAIYMRPEKTKSGIYLSDSTRNEDKWQGKVGLVLKKGPLAFVDDATHAFEGLDVEPGQWAVFSHSDGWSLDVHGVPCRMLQDVHIRARIQSPDEVW